MGMVDGNQTGVCAIMTRHNFKILDDPDGEMIEVKIRKSTHDALLSKAGHFTFCGASGSLSNTIDALIVLYERGGS